MWGNFMIPGIIGYAFVRHYEHRQKIKRKAAAFLDSTASDSEKWQEFLSGILGGNYDRENRFIEPESDVYLIRKEGSQIVIEALKGVHQYMLPGKYDRLMVRLRKQGEGTAITRHGGIFYLIPEHDKMLWVVFK